MTKPHFSYSASSDFIEARLQQLNSVLVNLQASSIFEKDIIGVLSLTVERQCWIACIQYVYYDADRNATISSGNAKFNGIYAIYQGEEGESMQRAIVGLAKVIYEADPKFAFDFPEWIEDESTEG